MKYADFYSQITFNHLAPIPHPAYIATPTPPSIYSHTHPNIRIYNTCTTPISAYITPAPPLMSIYNTCTPKPIYNTHKTQKCPKTHNYQAKYACFCTQIHEFRQLQRQRGPFQVQNHTHPTQVAKSHKSTIIAANGGPFGIILQQKHHFSTIIANKGGIYTTWGTPKGVSHPGAIFSCFCSIFT